MTEQTKRRWSAQVAGPRGNGYLDIALGFDLFREPGDEFGPPRWRLNILLLIVTFSIEYSATSDEHDPAWRLSDD